MSIRQYSNNNYEEARRIAEAPAPETWASSYDPNQYDNEEAFLSLWYGECVRCYSFIRPWVVYCDRCGGV